MGILFVAMFAIRVNINMYVIRSINYVHSAIISAVSKYFVQVFFLNIFQSHDHKMCMFLLQALCPLNTNSINDYVRLVLYLCLILTHSHKITFSFPWAMY